MDGFEYTDFTQDIFGSRASCVGAFDECKRGISVGYFDGRIYLMTPLLGAKYYYCAFVVSTDRAPAAAWRLWLEAFRFISLTRFGKKVSVSAVESEARNKDLLPLELKSAPTIHLPFGPIFSEDGFTLIGNIAVYEEDDVDFPNYFIWPKVKRVRDSDIRDRDIVARYAPLKDE